MRKKWWWWWSGNAQKKIAATTFIPTSGAAASVPGRPDSKYWVRWSVNFSSWPHHRCCFICFRDCICRDLIKVGRWALRPLPPPSSLWWEFRGFNLHLIKHSAATAEAHHPHTVHQLDSALQAWRAQFYQHLRFFSRSAKNTTGLLKQTAAG